MQVILFYGNHQKRSLVCRVGTVHGDAGGPGWHIECSAMIKGTSCQGKMRIYLIRIYSIRRKALLTKTGLSSHKDGDGDKGKDGFMIDIHGGGQDLQFPHHENECAQTRCAYGQELANVWMHNGMLQLDGEKMSKSLGNIWLVDELLQHMSGESSSLGTFANPLSQTSRFFLPFVGEGYETFG